MICRYSGEFDTTIVTENQLQNTLELFKSKSIPWITSVEPFGSEDISTMDFQLFHENYLDKIKRIKDLDIIRTPFWEMVRASNIEELGRSYEFQIKAMKGFQNPAILKEYYPEACDCFTYLDAVLHGGKRMLKAWRNLEDSLCNRNNYNPQLCFEERYVQKSKTRLRFIYAKKSLMIYGWGNCLRNYNLTYPYYGQKCEIEFRSIFQNYKYGCVE